MLYSIIRILVFSSLFVSLGLSSFAQQDREQSALYLDQAKLIMSETQAIDDARDLMIFAANSDTTNVEANFEAGRVHLITIGKDRAIKYFLRIYRQQPDFRFDLEYRIGQSYQYGLSFDNAIKFYELYKSKLQNNPEYNGKDFIPTEEVERRLEECNNGKEFVANPKKFSIVNMGREINSEFDDYAPVLDENEEKLVFTSRRRDGNLNEDVFEDNKPYEDIFYASKSGEKWSSAENIGDMINTLYHDSNLALSSDGKTLFIRKDVNRGDIFFSVQQDDGAWSVPEALEGYVNSPFIEASVSISKDGNTMYFSSDRPGGLGGTDIYYSTKNRQNKWTKIKNVGPKINTEYDEDSPFIDYDGKTLYFSSKGGKGMGGFDIFKTTLLNPGKNEWSDPENLGYPINTPDNDIYYVGSKDREKGYYSTTREDGMGYEDIYMITDKVPKVKKEPEVVTEFMPLTYMVNVVDADSKKPLDAKVRMQEAKDNVMVGSRTLEAGSYEFTVTSANSKSYLLSVEAEGYIFQNINLDIQGVSERDSSETHVVEMHRLVVGAHAVLRNIYFDFGKATFKEASYAELNKLESMMNQNERISVEILGHTDNVSSADFNMRLSIKRANAVRGFLVKKGIDIRRITVVGFGEKRPLASNDDEEEGREINRRVEFKVLSN